MIVLSLFLKFLMYLLISIKEWFIVDKLNLGLHKTKQIVGLFRISHPTKFCVLLLSLCDVKHVQSAELLDIFLIHF